MWGGSRLADNLRLEPESRVRQRSRSRKGNAEKTPLSVAGETVHKGGTPSLRAHSSTTWEGGRGKRRQARNFLQRKIFEKKFHPGYLFLVVRAEGEETRAEM